MIGGTDFVIPVRNPMVAMEFALRLAARMWPSAFFEDANTGEGFYRHDEISLATCNEILVSKNRRAAEEFDRLGSCPETDGTLIHLIGGRESITVCLDDRPSTQTLEFVTELKKRLNGDVLFAAVV